MHTIPGEDRTNARINYDLKSFRHSGDGRYVLKFHNTMNLQVVETTYFQLKEDIKNFWACQIDSLKDCQTLPEGALSNYDASKILGYASHFRAGENVCHTVYYRANKTVSQKTVNSLFPRSMRFLTSSDQN